MALSRLRALYGRYPTLSNMVIYGGLYGGGDISQQTLLQRPEYDWGSVMRLAAVGSCIFGPIYYAWYVRLDKLLPGNAGITVLKKTVIDQTLIGALGAFGFFFSTSALEGHSPKACMDEAVAKWPRTYFTGWLFWPFVQIINFRLLPTSLRAPWVGANAFIWTNFLAYMKSTTIEKPPSDDDLKQQDKQIPAPAS